MPYGSIWREHRRTFHQFFNQTASVPYHPHEVKAARKLLLRLMETPEEFNDHLLQYGNLMKPDDNELTLPLTLLYSTVTEVIMKVMYGIQIQGKDDKFIQIAEAALESLTLGVPGQFLVDSIPICE